MSEGQRVRVSAWVLGARSHQKKGSAKIPDFPGLSESEKSAAMLLIRMSAQRAKDREQLVKGHDLAATVAPALAIVQQPQQPQQQSVCSFKISLAPMLARTLWIAR
jgi:hypothetical protein